MSPFKKGVLALLVIVLLGSIAARAFTSSGGPAPTAGGDSELATGFLPTEPGGQSDGSASAAAEPEPEGLEAWLPYLTEGSFFALIGFALGYASRKMAKVGLIVLALFFAGLQALTYTGSVTVDWGGVVESINRLIFNLKENQSVTEFLTSRIPSAGSLVAGYVLGLRRG